MSAHDLAALLLTEAFFVSIVGHLAADPHVRALAGFGSAALAAND